MDALDWPRDAPTLVAALEAAGFDVDDAHAALRGGGGSLSARRERGSRVEVVTLDAGGRLQVAVTVSEGEAGVGRREVAGVAVRGVESATRRLDLSGRLDQATQLAPLLAALPDLGPGSRPRSDVAGGEW